MTSKYPVESHYIIMYQWQDTLYMQITGLYLDPPRGRCFLGPRLATSNERTNQRSQRWLLSGGEDVESRLQVRGGDASQGLRLCEKRGDIWKQEATGGLGEVVLLSSFC